MWIYNESAFRWFPIFLAGLFTGILFKMLVDVVKKAVRRYYEKDWIDDSW
tara:strand:+ start:1730 stop:1879 length:150 start_codon:yes stop_codon:yes gene_type:complete